MGVVTFHPYTMYENGGYDGILFQLWNMISMKNWYDNVYVDYQYDISKLMKDVQSGKLDVGIGPIGILAERYARVAFTFPVLQGTYVLLAKKTQSSFWQRFNDTFHGYFIEIFIALLILYYAYLHLFHYYEHQTIPDIKEYGYAKGVAHLFWKSTYGNFAYPYFPQSNMIRIITLVWSFFFISVVISTFTGITKAFVTGFHAESQPLVSIEEIKKQPITTLSSGPKMIAEQAGLNVAYENASIKDALELLNTGKVVGIMMLYEQAESYIDKYGDQDLYIAPIQFPELFLAFIFNPNKRYLLPQINEDILKFTENKKMYLICKIYRQFINPERCL